MNLHLIWVAVFVATAPLHAQEVGETVIIVAPKKAELKRDDRVVDSLPRGAPAAIEAVGATSLRVGWLGLHGWVNKKETMRLADAIAYFTRGSRNSPTHPTFGAAATLGSAAVTIIRQSSSFHSLSDSTRSTTRYIGFARSCLR